VTRSTSYSNTYACGGTFTVTVRDTDGLSDDATVQVVASDPPPQAALAVSQLSALLQVTADASGSTDNDGIVGHAFDFEDGSAVATLVGTATTTVPLTTSWQLVSVCYAGDVLLAVGQERRRTGSLEP
jgi:hypothetical protein